MPAPKKAPKPKQDHVLVWNKGSHRNGHYVAGNVILNYLIKDRDGKPSPVIHVITTGLSEVPAEHWARAMADAEKKAGAKHGLVKMRESGRLCEVDLSRMSPAEVRQAIDETSDKSLLTALAEGKREVPEHAQEHAAEVRRTWNKEDNSISRKVTRHFASFQRAS
jgi:hypothetical protein